MKNRQIAKEADNHIKDRKRIDRKMAYILLPVFLVMLLLNFMTPLLADDFTYCFSFATGERIENVSDILSSMAAHRVQVNGRVEAHFLVQLFLILPKFIFNIVNAAAAAFLLFLSEKFFAGKSKDGCNFILLLLVALALFCFIPEFGEVFLWLDGSVNYSWALLFSTLYVLAFYREYMGSPMLTENWHKILFVLFSFLVGAYSESFSFAAIFITFFILLFSLTEKSRPFPKYLLICFCAACLGYLFLMLSPSETGGRTNELSLSAVARAFKYIVQTTRSELGVLYCVYFLIVGVYIADLRNQGKTEAGLRNLLMSLAIFAAGLASALMFSFAKYYPPRAMLASAWWTIIAGAILLSALWPDERKLCSVLASVCTVMFAFNFILGFMDIAVQYKAAKERETIIYEAISAGESSVILDAYKPETKYSAAHGLQDISTGENVWPNDSIAAYYGLDSVSGNIPG